MEDSESHEYHRMSDVDSAEIQGVPKKPSSRLRWTVLTLSCVMMLGSYYCFDIPSAIKTQIRDYMGTDESEYETYFALMYSLYAIPNVILPFFGGYFVDKFGQCFSLLVSTSFLLVGQCVVSLGFSVKSWDTILAGRFIFALGGENLIVASSALLADWFIGKELAFSFGINLALARVGSVLNNYFSVVLAKKLGVVASNWMGAVICGLSVISVLLTMPIDKKFDEQIAAAKENLGIAPQAVDGINEFKKAWRTVVLLPKIFWVLIGITVITYGVVVPFNNVASSLLLERTYFQDTPAGCTLQYSGQCQSDSNTPTCDIGENIPRSDVDCGESLWSSEGSCTYIYCDKLSKAEKTVSYIMSIPYLISGFASPVFGIAIDYYGLRAFLTWASSVVLVLVHAFLAWSSCSPVIPLIGQGLAYTAFAAVLWPAIPLVVSEDQRGLSFGIGTASYNAGCATVPLVAAYVYTHSGNDYIPNVEIFPGTWSATELSRLQVLQQCLEQGT
eukprot:GSChrysophyteH1.ASY1.ANO1.2359.1 assembled CDS